MIFHCSAFKTFMKNISIARNVIFKNIIKTHLENYFQKKSQQYLRPLRFNPLVPAVYIYIYIATSAENEV